MGSRMRLRRRQRRRKRNHEEPPYETEYPPITSSPRKDDYDHRQLPISPSLLSGSEARRKISCLVPFALALIFLLLLLGSRVTAFEVSVSSVGVSFSPYREVSGRKCIRSDESCRTGILPSHERTAGGGSFRRTNRNTNAFLWFALSDSENGSSSSPDGEDHVSSKHTNQQHDETQRRMEQQQRQIDTLMELVQHQQQQHQISPAANRETVSSTSNTTSFSSSSSTSPMMAPIKAMMFIDGTWLYYSIHERQLGRCPISEEYGMGWQTRYSFDWAALPRIVCEQLQQQQVGWSSATTTTTTGSSGAAGNATTPGSTRTDVAATSSSRPVEVVRAMVFTSVKKATSPYSNRLRMFQDMNHCNYDVHMMETVGSGEKCVDIQLAVEMLHYATVPNAYDVAILVSGDKDFLPALIRTRQKARQVCIVSMRPSCNRALYETPNVKDYEPIWIEDYLDQLMVPKEDASGEGSTSTVSLFALMKVIYDFIDKAPKENGRAAVVSSRDIGRYLKRLEIGGRILLDEIKDAYGGLFQFLSVSGCFEVLKRPPLGDMRPVNPTDKSFWATLRPTTEETLLAEAKRTHFSQAEKNFFDSYSTKPLDDGTVYQYLSGSPRLRHVSTPSPVSQEELELPAELTRDFTKLKVVELKEICRERGLSVTGTKAALLEKIETDIKEEVENLMKKNRSRVGMRRVRVPSRVVADTTFPNPEKGIYLEKLVREYLQASGGEASSRDVGRYLAANAGYSGKRGTKALAELKSLYGGLAAFLAEREDVFTMEEVQTGESSYEFRIGLRNSE